MNREASERATDLLREWEQEIVDFASRLVAAPSPTPPGDERQVAAMLQAELATLGLEEVAVAAKEPERPNVICRIAGDRSGGGRRLILNGHIDTKPAGDRASWETDPYKPAIRDGRLYGLGTTDMKGAIAAMVYAGAAVARACPDLPGELQLIFTADEEGGSRYGGRYLVEEVGLDADAAIICEPSGISRSWEFICPVARGITCFRLRLRGTQMHSSLSDRLPSINASVKLAQLLVWMDEGLSLTVPAHPLCPDGATVNPGVTLHGGVTYGVVPGQAEFGVDVRTVPGMTQAQLARDLEAFLAECRRKDPELDVELVFEPGSQGWTPPTEVAADAPVVQAVEAAAAQVLGTAPPLRAFPAVTDGAHFAAAGIDTIPAFGPGLLPLAHRPNEYIELDSIGEAARIYALSAIYYLGGMVKVDV